MGLVLKGLMFEAFGHLMVCLMISSVERMVWEKKEDKARHPKAIVNYRSKISKKVQAL